jgi:hypothetical protein
MLLLTVEGRGVDWRLGTHNTYLRPHRGLLTPDAVL